MHKARYDLVSIPISVVPHTRRARKHLWLVAKLQAAQPTDAEGASSSPCFILVTALLHACTPQGAPCTARLRKPPTFATKFTQGAVLLFPDFTSAQALGHCHSHHHTPATPKTALPRHLAGVWAASASLSLKKPTGQFLDYLLPTYQPQTIQVPGRGICW